MTQPLEIFRALADESRLRLVHLLSLGSFNVHELTAIIGVGQSTVSHHLKQLHSASLVTQRREGTWIYYTLTAEGSELSSTITRAFLASLKENKLPIFIDDAQRANETLATRRDQARSFFDAVAPQWKTMRHEAQGSENHLPLLLSRIPSHGTLIDLGCGSGALFEKLLPREGPSIGVDYSPAMLEEARRTLGNKGEGLDLRLGNLEHLPVGDESVDVATIYMALHHVSQPADAIVDAFRIVRPGGMLLILDLMPHRNEMMRQRFADLWLGFAPEEVKRWAFAAGFSDSRLEILGQKKDVFLMTFHKKGSATP